MVLYLAQHLHNMKTHWFWELGLNKLIMVKNGDKWIQVLSGPKEDVPLLKITGFLLELIL